MREIEFLPDWYPQICRSKQRVVLQAWVSGVVVVALSLWVFLAHHNVRAAEAALTNLDGQMSQAQSDLAKLDELIRMQKQWRQQDDIIAKLGLHVETTRLLKAIEAAMPPEMSIVDVALLTEEQQQPKSNLAAAREERETERPIDRRLKVRLQGVTPTDVDLANFLGQLSAAQYFENIAMTYARDRSESGHIMREFEVTFTMNLNAASE